MLNFRHQHISFFKSALRLWACLVLWPFSPAASALLGIAEVIGILEEIGHE